MSPLLNKQVDWNKYCFTYGGARAPVFDIVQKNNLEKGEEMSLGTPNNIDILIHCHCCADEHPRSDAPAVIKGIQFLVDNGLIMLREKGTTFVTTEKGASHLRQLCNLEFPRQVWISSIGNIL